MAVAATFLTVSATSAWAQGDQIRNSAAELAIDAAIPRPEPANVPPPTASDFKLDTPVPASDAAKVTEKSAPEPTTTKPAAVVTAPASEPAKLDAGIPRPEPANVPPPTASDFKPDTQPTASDAATPSPEPAKEPVKAASNVPPADQPVADRLRDAFAAKSLRYFDRKVERAAVEKFYTSREFAPIWTAAAG